MRDKTYKVVVKDFLGKWPALRIESQESVRRLHNSENTNTIHKPGKTAINSSHNLAVTTHLFKELRTTFTDVDPECVKGCKTYFETLRRKYSLAQPEKAQKRNTMKNTAKNRQRKRRLLETRSSVVQTNTERELWKTATIELMSDEDAIVDGRPVWMVRSPPNRTTELSALCQVFLSLFLFLFLSLSLSLSLFLFLFLFLGLFLHLVLSGFPLSSALSLFL
ncbi:unnamed protein product [Leuciscus chuanchicus]